MSIFDDDQPEAQPSRPKRPKNPFADPDERREPGIDSSTQFTDDDPDGDSDDNFEPMDNNRNRHLSSSLNNIRDDGPAHQPEKPPQTTDKQQPVRNPFASSEPETAATTRSAPSRPASTHKVPPQTPPQPAAQPRPQQPQARPQPKPRPAAPQADSRKSEPTTTKTAPQVAPQVAPQAPPLTTPRPTPPSPPEFARHAHRSNSSGLTNLILWALVAMAVLLASWNMMRLSSIDSRIDALSAKIDSQAGAPGNSASEGDTSTTDARLARLENNLLPLETRLDNVQKQLSDSGQAEQIAALEKRVAELQKNLKASAKTAIAAKPTTTATTVTPKTTPKALSAPKPAGWVVNIASLSNRKNANALANKAIALGTDTRVDSYPSQGRTLYRIRAYGYATQSAAEEGAQQLQTALDISGMLVRKVE